MTLNLQQAALFLGYEDKGSLRRAMRADPTIPGRKVGTGWRFIQGDLEAWLRAGYSAEAKAALREETCEEVRPVAVKRGSSTSESMEYERQLEQRTRSARSGSGSKGKTKPGTVRTVASSPPGSAPAWNGRG